MYEDAPSSSVVDGAVACLNASFMALCLLGTCVVSPLQAALIHLHLRPIVHCTATHARVIRQGPILVCCVEV